MKKEFTFSRSVNFFEYMNYKCYKVLPLPEWKAVRMSFGRMKVIKIYKFRQSQDG